METIPYIDLIEKNYQAFLNTKIGNSDLTGVEYIGINFCEKKLIPVFKCYYTTAKSLPDIHPILEDFFVKGMIRALNLIKDTVHTGKIRYEIGLSNRNNENMNWLYRWISSFFPLTEQQISKLSIMANLRCCGFEEYQYAALYFLGFIANNSSIADSKKLEAVKLHYLLRMCKDPDRIGREYYIEEESVFSVLESVSEFKPICSIVKPLLHDTGSELWMAAMDFFTDEPAKYKLYVKIKKPDFCSFLSSLLNQHNVKGLAQKIIFYSQWLIMHPELELYGAALCCSESGEWSVNVYH